MSDTMVAEPLDPDKPYLFNSADGADPHRAWTVQSPTGATPAMPGRGDFPATRFHPDELPNPEVIRQAGFPLTHLIQGLTHLIDRNHHTESPMGVAPYNPPADHPDSQPSALAQVETAVAAVQQVQPAVAETEDPGAEEPEIEEPEIEEPSTDEPQTDAPSTEEPGTEEPQSEPGAEENPSEQPSEG